MLLSETILLTNKQTKNTLLWTQPGFCKPGSVTSEPWFSNISSRHPMPQIIWKLVIMCVARHGGSHL